MRRSSNFLFLLAACVLIAAPAWSQVYPSKPIRLIVPYPPGGGADAFARSVAQVMTQNGNVTFVDNRPGAAGLIGADALAHAPSDGYTIAIFPTAVATHSFIQKLTFDLKDLAVVTTVAKHPMVLSVPATSTARTLSDVIQLARSKPGALTYGQPGNLGAGHLSMEMLKLNNRVDIISVPYKGAGPALTDLLGGQLDMGVGGTASHLASIRAGKLRPIATTSLQRSRELPDVPTFAESGQPGFDMNEWFCLFVPSRVDGRIVARLNELVTAALTHPDLRATFAGLGAEAQGSKVDEARQLYASEVEKARKLISTLGLKAE